MVQFFVMVVCNNVFCAKKQLEKKSGISENTLSHFRKLVFCIIYDVIIECQCVFWNNWAISLKILLTQTSLNLVLGSCYCWPYFFLVGFVWKCFFFWVMTISYKNDCHSWKKCIFLFTNTPTINFKKILSKNDVLLQLFVEDGKTTKFYYVRQSMPLPFSIFPVSFTHF